MNLLLGEEFAVIALVTAGAVALVTYSKVVSLYRVQTRGLEASAEVMTAHFDALAKLMEEPVVPAALCNWLLSLHEAVKDPELCSRLAAILERDMPYGTRPDAYSSDLHGEISWLAGNRPELLGEVMRSLASLLYGAQLRHLANDVVALRRGSAPRKTPAVAAAEQPNAMAYKLDRAVEVTGDAPYQALAA